MRERKTMAKAHGNPYKLLEGPLDNSRLNARDSWGSLFQVAVARFFYSILLVFVGWFGVSDLRFRVCDSRLLQGHAGFTVWVLMPRVGWLADWI